MIVQLLTLIGSFNPHPPIKAGETGFEHCSIRRADRFNPHPPIKAGETSRKA